MQIKKVIVTSVLLVFAITICTSIAYGAWAGAAWTSATSAGIPKTSFTQGATIYVNWDGGDTNVDIKVLDHLGNPVQVWLNQGVTGQVSYIEPTSGSFSANVYDQGTSNCKAACTFIVSPLVVPESPIGALTAVTACFAAFAMFGVISVKRGKSKKE